MLKNGKSLFRKKIVVYTLNILCCLLWGSAFPFIKIGYKLFGIASGNTASQILFAGVRFTLTGILTILVSSLFSKRFLLPHKESLINIGKLGLVQTVIQYIFFYVGLSNAAAAKASIINGSIPFIAIVIACFIYRQEKFTKFKLLGSLLGLAGIMVINMDFKSLTTNMTLTGEGFIFISSIASALSSSMTKNYAQKENPVVLSGYQFILGGTVMMIIGFSMGGTLNINNSNALLVLAYLSLLSVVASSLMSILLKYNDVSKIVIFSFAIPVFGVILSALLLGESKQALNLQSLASLLMVSLGVVIINKRKPKGNLQRM